MQSCASEASINQVLFVRGDYNIISGLEVISTFQNAASCFASSYNQVEIAQSLASTLKAKVEQKPAVVMFGIGIGQTTINETIVQRVFETHMTTSIESCRTALNLDQNLSLVGSYNYVTGVAFNANNIMGMECVFDSKNLVKVTQAVSAEINAEIEQQTAGMEWLATIFIAIAIIALGAAVIVIIFKFVQGRKNDPRKATGKKYAVKGDAYHNSKNVKRVYGYDKRSTMQHTKKEEEVRYRENKRREQERIRRAEAEERRQNEERERREQSERRTGYPSVINRFTEGEDDYEYDPNRYEDE